MNYTIAEKILLAHSGKKEIAPGEFIEATVDLALGNDITAPLAIRKFKESGTQRVFNPDKLALIPDHFVPAKDMRSANQAKTLAVFAKEQGIKNYFEVGCMGIEHALLPEKKLVLPGDLIVGADSHTCTYGAVGAFATGVGSTDMAAAMATGDLWMKVPQTIKFIYHGNLGKWVGGKDLILHTIGHIGVDGALYSAMEFTGEAIEALPIDGRFNMANMAIEAGGKAGLFRVDNKTQLYIKSKAQRPYNVYEPDPDAEYENVIEYDFTGLEPQVAFPHSPANARPVTQAGDININQAIIGSCTNGRIDDLRVAAQIFKGKKVHHGVRCIIIPGSQQVYADALNEGLIATFIEADAAVSTPTCGPCFGGHTGVIAEGERCISTTNRNFVGRMGHPKSEVYLANPAVAAASAITGHISHPDEVAK